MVVGLICSLIPTQLLLTRTKIPSSSFCFTNYCSDISSSALLSSFWSIFLIIIFALFRTFTSSLCFVNKSVPKNYSINQAKLLLLHPIHDIETERRGRDLYSKSAILWTVDLRTNRTCKTLVRDIVVWNRVRINPYLVYGRRTRYIIGKEKTWRQKRKRYRNFSLSDILKLLETTTENKTKKDELVQLDYYQRKLTYQLRIEQQFVTKVVDGSPTQLDIDSYKQQELESVKEWFISRT